MKTNVGGFDKTARIIAGVVLIGLTATGVLGPWGWLGVIPLVTGLLNVCPLYSVFGISSCPVTPKDPQP